ncbi:MAG: hypothetical protein JOZ27_02215 [Caulobacteraceae bacterium]|nr:hypothetical protein [Caulobacteraceae bacterium]
MIHAEARAILGRLIAPLPLDAFLAHNLGRRFAHAPGNAASPRAHLLGDDPERTVLAAHEFAPHLGSHAVEPLGPAPTLGPVADAGAFQRKIRSFHDLGYTVRVPLPRWLAPAFAETLRALEALLHKPVSAEAFWSRGGGRAPPHHDNHDIFVVHLLGRKRWHVSTDPVDLPNNWETVPRTPSLERSLQVEVGPGDLLYLPRGAVHRVDALTDSLHLSIGFVPLTLREAMIAAIDHLSDLDRPLRESVAQPLARGAADRALAAAMGAGFARLAELCAAPAFVNDALQRRSSRAVRDLQADKAPTGRVKVTPASVVAHRPLEVAHLHLTGGKIDFSHPGGHLYIHAGAEEAVRFIAATPRFRVGDIPGPIGDDVRVTLAEEFLAAGFLELAP